MSSEDAQLFEAQAEFCKSLCHPIRLKIISLLYAGPRNVSEIVNSLGEPQPVVSRHLALLREKGVVRAERRGTNVYYYLAYPELEEACRIVRRVIRKMIEERAQALQRR